MRIEYHEYANEADDDNDVPKPAQSLGTPVPRQKLALSFVCQQNIVCKVKPIFLKTIKS